MADLLSNIQTLTLVIIVLALIFDFINGFHDSANAVATIVATRVLKHWQACAWSAVFNFMAFFFVTAGVAKMVGSGLIDLSMITSEVIMAGLIAGIIWNLLTWWWGMPASSSHTMLGAYAGAAFVHVYMVAGPDMENPYKLMGWLKVFAFVFIAPLVGYFIGFIILRMTRGIQLWAIRNRTKRNWNSFYRGAQLASSAALSFNHGANDAQKTAGLIAGALVTGGYMSQAEFHIPDWVMLAAFIAISLGTLVGGWRITKTLGFRLTKLRPVHGFSAEMGAAGSIGLSTMLSLPISTTLATTGSIVGVGAARGRHRVDWSVFKTVATVWAFTFPASFTMGAVAMFAVGAVLGY